MSVIHQINRVAALLALLVCVAQCNVIFNFREDPVSGGDEFKVILPDVATEGRDIALSLQARRESEHDAKLVELVFGSCEDSIDFGPQYADGKVLLQINTGGQSTRHYAEMSIADSDLSHVFTLLIRSDGSYEIYVDMKLQARIEGNDLHWDSMIAITRIQVHHYSDEMMSLQKFENIVLGDDLSEVHGAIDSTWIAEKVAEGEEKNLATVLGDVPKKEEQAVEDVVAEPSPELRDSGEATIASDAPGKELFDNALLNFSSGSHFGDIIEPLQQSAAKGFPDAQHLMAVLYTYGISVNQSDALAILLHKLAALSGNIESHMALAFRYQYGIGAPKSCVKAVSHARLAADFVAKRFAGDIAAKVPMVTLSDEPSTQKTNALSDTDFVNLHYRRAERGDAAAKVILGYSHMLGLHGLQQDGHLALKYFGEAAKNGAHAAHGGLGQLYSQGMKSANPPIEKDMAKAFHHFSEGAKEGHSTSQNGLGYIFSQGTEDVPRDFEKAAEYFRLSAENGNSEGMYNLGVLKLNGLGVPRNIPMAVSLFQNAATEGSILAKWQLGVLHSRTDIRLPQYNLPNCQVGLQYLNEVTAKGPWILRIPEAHEEFMNGQYDAALLHYLMSATLGYEVAIKNAAYMMEHDFSLTMEFLQGSLRQASQEHPGQHVLVSLLYQSAIQGEVLSHVKLGDIYFYGIGGRHDFSKALSHYQAAAALGNGQAYFNLGLLHQFDFGIGVARDFHMAKRYFDQALQANPSAYYAVKAALILLNFHWWHAHFGGLGLPGVMGIPIDDAILYFSLAAVVLLLLLRHHAVVV